MRKARFLVVLVVLAAGHLTMRAQTKPEDPIDVAVEALPPSDIPALTQKAESGAVVSQLVLGPAYHWGRGVSANQQLAAQWIRKAPGQGHPGAQNMIGVFYGKGIGVPQDEVEAVNWYRLTAEQSIVRAQYNLVSRYWYSIGVPKDPVEAAKWYRKAAEQGDADAQCRFVSTDQNSTGPPSNPTGQDENSKRILGIFPNFQTKDDIPQNRQPLTAKEKYVLAYHQTVDISAHFGNAFQAVLRQASNGQPHYGQGRGAYAERFAAAEADRATSAFFIFGFLPHVLHEDPRYLRQAKGSVWSRIRYSATRTVITRTDAGNPTFNIPQVAGQLLQQSISTAYYPDVDRTAGRVLQNWGINLAYTGAYNVLKELYPDFLRIVFHRHRKQQPTATAQPPARITSAQMNLRTQSNPSESTPPL